MPLPAGAGEPVVPPTAAATVEEELELADAADEEEDIEEAEDDADEALLDSVAAVALLLLPEAALEHTALFGTFTPALKKDGVRAMVCERKPGTVTCCRAS